VHLIIGLGNPGKEYELTRHNAGRMVLERIHATHAFSPWNKNGKPPMQTAVGTLAGEKVTLIAPDTFMNKSGAAAAHYIKNKKGAGNLIVVHDDLDLPLGSLKISYGRSSGGHNGVESIIKALKTNEFIRVRVGVSPHTPKGVAKKPKGEEKVLKFLLGKFSANDLTELKKSMKRVIESIETIVSEGHQMGMNKFN
jgi:PTH1 family peptidyl-tRNA hydrolase